MLFTGCPIFTWILIPKSDARYCCGLHLRSLRKERSWQNHIPFSVNQRFGQQKSRYTNAYRPDLCGFRYHIHVTGFEIQSQNCPLRVPITDSSKQCRSGGISPGTLLPYPILKLLLNGMKQIYDRLAPKTVDILQSHESGTIMNRYIFVVISIVVQKFPDFYFCCFKYFRIVG